MTLRLTPARFALSYIALGVVALALLAVPLWYGFRANVGTFRDYVPGAEMQRFVDIFHRDGPQAVAAAMDAYATTLPPDQVAVFVGPQKQRLAGNLPHWPAEVPDVPGIYGLVIGLGGDASMRVVVSHVALPDGYVLLMGRESVIFDSLVARFWFGIAGAMAVLLSLGVLFGWLLRRAHGQLEGLVEQRTAELRLTEERYARAMEGSDAGHWDWNVVTDELFISDRARRMLALPADALPERRSEMMELVPMHPDDRAVMDEKVSAGIRSGVYERDYRVIPRAGEVRWLRSRGKIYRDARGAAVRMTGSLTDITERRLAADALRGSEERYSLAMEASEEGYIDVNVDTGSFVTSERLNEILGIAPGTRFTGRSDFLSKFRLYGSDGETYRQAIRTVEADGGPDRYQFEFRIVLPSGDVRWIRTRGKVVRDAEGRPHRRVGVFADVTERKRAAEALKRSEERFALAVAGSNDGLWDWDILTNEMFLSERAQRIYGLEPGRTIRPRAEWRALVKIHPDDIEGQLRSVEDYLARKSANYEGEWRVLHPDGRYRWIRIRGTCVRDTEGRPTRFAGSVSEIDVRRRAEEELRDSEARFRSLTELSSDWYWRQDEALRFTYVSHQVADDGYPLERAIGRTRWELPGITPLSSSWAEHQAVLAARQPFRDFECTLIGRDGRTEYVSVSGAPIFDEQGIFRGYQGIGRNTSERKRADEELKALERKLRQAQRLEAMGTLAGGIAHDFNNILGAILGYGEMALRDAPKDSRLHRDLDSIIVAGERGRALVDRVLAFSRSGVGERTAVHVEKVVREALDLLSAKLPPDVTLHAKLHAERAAMLGDATQVHQVLTNLATNAVQAMPAGGTLRVSLDALHIGAPRVPTIGILAKGDYIVLRVADMGTGIAPDILERIFDPFFTTKEVGTGTGLGLSLVHGIVSDVGGAIDVASTPDAGSTFTVYLPRSGDAAEERKDRALPMPRGDGQRVLVVDDEESLVHLAMRTLRELGYVPTGFTSSAAALAAFRADPKAFDALVTDERMPGMSGSALIRKVRDIRDAIPIVLMSGYVGGAMTRQAREACVQEVLKKPLSARDLATTLARVLHS